MDLTSPFAEPNQLTIDNFVEFLNIHSQSLLNLDERGESSRNRVIESEDRDDCEAVRDNGGGCQLGKDDASCEDWSAFDCKVLMDRKEASSFAQKIRKRSAKTSNSLLPPFIQEYEEESPSKERQDEFLREMTRGQRNNVRDFNSKHPFSISLFKRLSVLETVFNSLSKKFHSLKVAKSSNKTKPKDSKKEKGSHGLAPQGTDVMVQLGVQTGLTLLFSLMKQTWMQNSQSSEICSGVLNTVGGIINSLPPLSLANNAKLPKLAKNSLDQIMDFLKDVMKGKVTDDISDRRLCAEILIGLALQRGSLLLILDWIETGFRSSLAANQISVGRQTMNYWIRQMHNISSTGVRELA